MDTVFIQGLKATTTIGVYEHERKIKQTIIIDLKMSFDNRPPGLSDNLGDALDYEAISQRTISYVESSKHYLIESMAENLSHLLLEEFSIDKLILTISKPGAVSTADNIGVRIVRP